MLVSFSGVLDLRGAQYLDGLDAPFGSLEFVKEPNYASETEDGKPINTSATKKCSMWLTFTRV